MQRYIRLALLLLVFTVSVVIPQSVFAQMPSPTPPINPNCIESELGCVPTDVGGFVQQYYGYGLSMIGGLALLFIIYGGYMILTSRGNPMQLNNGKSYIGYAILGVLLAIFGYLFVEVIAVDVLHIPGFS